MSSEPGGGLSLGQHEASLRQAGMSGRTEPKPEPHPGVAGLAIACMGLVLALVLDRLGVLRSVDRSIGSWVQGFGLDGDLRGLDPWMAWTWAMLMTVGLCQAVLHVRRAWRRMILIMGALVLTVSWIPILALAAIEPMVSGSLIALLWGGVGSLIYAQRHREPD